MLWKLEELHPNYKGVVFSISKATKNLYKVKCIVKEYSLIDLDDSIDTYGAFKYYSYANSIEEAYSLSLIGIKSLVKGTYQKEVDTTISLIKNISNF